MAELEDLKQCSPDLGNISLNQCTEECHVLQRCGEDSSPIGVVASGLQSFHVRSRSYLPCTRRFGKCLTETERICKPERGAPGG